MSTTAMLTGNALAVKLWEKQDFLDMVKSTVFGRMLSTGTLFFAKELNGAAKGDQTTFAFTGLINDVGRTEGGTMRGNESALTLSSNQMAINVSRIAVKNPNEDTIEQQRTLVSFEDNAREMIREWHKSRIEWGIFNQLGGANSTTYLIDGTTYSVTGDLPIVRGHNTVNAPSTNRVIRAGSRANDESLTSADTFTLDLVDAAIEKAMSTYPTIQPINRNGEESYDLYISYEQLTDLKRDTTGKIQWSQIYLAALSGGMMENNPVFTNSIGAKAVAKYANVYLIPSVRVPYGVNSSTSALISTVRRAILCGKNAAAYGAVVGGRLSDKNVPFIYKTEMDDYEYYKGIEGRRIDGVKKLQFQSEDYGSIVLSTYAAAHTS